MINAKWHRYSDLRDRIALILDSEHADQTPPRFDQVFDRMIAACSVAGPEEVIEHAEGHFTSVGHLVIYEDWRLSPDYAYTETHEGQPTELDGWILTTLQNDAGYTISKIGNLHRTINFSHEEPEWEPRLLRLLDRTYWRVLNVDKLCPTG